MADFSTTRVTAAQQMNRLSAGVAGTYGFEPGAAAGSGAVTVSTGLTVNVAAIAAGAYRINDSIISTAYGASTVTHDAASPTNPRIDVVKINSSGAVGIEKGTAAATPVPPTLASTELELAQVLVGAGVTEITGGDILDRRQFLAGVAIIVKPDDETVNTSSTLQNDDDFSFPVEANSAYLVEIDYLMTSGTTPDFKWAFTLPSGATGRASYQVGASWSTNNDVTFAANVDGLSGERLYLIHVLIETAGAAGTAQWQWAQNTSDASDTTVGANSVLRYRKVA